MDIRTFQDLIAWQKARLLVKEVYKATAEMPDQERFGLIAQLRRAAVSIPSNIAEGYGRQSRTEYVRFIKVARGSLMELHTQLILSKDLHFHKTPKCLTSLLYETDRVLQALIRSLEKQKPP